MTIERAPQRPAPLAFDTNDAKLIDLWLRTKRSAHTRSAYARDVRRLLDRGVQLRTLTLDQLLDFQDTLVELAPATQKRIMSAAKSLLTFGHTNGYLSFNVGAAIALPKPKNTLAERISDEESVLRMLALETDPRRRMVLRLLYAGGVRVSELCGLCWRDAVANGDAGQITVLGKGDETRAIVLSAATWRELQGFKLRGALATAPIFATRTGKPVDRFWVHDMVKKAAQRAGLPDGFSPHWLRHAHGSHALDRGAPISLVKETLGHANIATTNQYVHARPDDSSARYLPI